MEELAIRAISAATPEVTSGASADGVGRGSVIDGSLPEAPLCWQLPRILIGRTIRLKGSCARSTFLARPKRQQRGPLMALPKHLKSPCGLGPRGESSIEPDVCVGRLRERIFRRRSSPRPYGSPAGEQAGEKFLITSPTFRPRRRG